MSNRGSIKPEAFYSAHRRAADIDVAIRDLLVKRSPISGRELRALATRRPSRFNRFAGYLAALDAPAGLTFR